MLVDLCPSCGDMDFQYFPKTGLCNCSSCGEIFSIDEADFREDYDDDEDVDE